MEQLQPHLRLGPNHAAKYAILPGDPGRVDRIKAFLDNPRDLAFNREYKSCMGQYQGTSLLVVSGGIGGTSTGIAVEELRKIGVETVLRVGSCGALQKGIKLGDILIAGGAVRDDGASKAYIETAFPAVADARVLAAAMRAANQIKARNHVGIVRSHDSFYTDENDEIEAYWAKKGVLGCDSESAALFVIGALRNLRAVSILNVVVTSGGDLEESINDYVGAQSMTMRGEENAILTALQAIALLEKEDARVSPA